MTQCQMKRSERVCVLSLGKSVNKISLEEYLDKLRRKLRRKHGTRTSSAHPE